MLGDLCQRARAAHYLPATRDWLQRVTGATIPDEYLDPLGGPLDQAIVMLRKSYRFKPEGGIGALAALVNEEMPDHPPNHLSPERCPAAIRPPAGHHAGRPGTDRGHPAARHECLEFADLVLNGYRGYLTAMRDNDPGDDATQDALDQWARAIVRAQGGFQLLAALRQGPWGSDWLTRTDHRDPESCLAAGPSSGPWTGGHRIDSGSPDVPCW